MHSLNRGGRCHRVAGNFLALALWSGTSSAAPPHHLNHKDPREGVSKEPHITMTIYRTSSLSAAVTAALALSFAVAAPAFAQDNSNANSDDVVNLDRVLVTGTRALDGQNPRLVANTIITREDIERLQPSSLGDLLQSQTGMQTTRLGGIGKESSLFLRGSESDHVLFLIDGVRVGSATAGKEAFQDLPLDQIDRIEIVRGPYSSLYGSDAIGGVVQIFTRKGENGVRPSLSVKAGSSNLVGLSAGIRGGNDKGQYALNAAHEETTGYNTCRGSGTLFQGCYTDEPDRDGYENRSISGSASYSWTPSLRSQLTALHIEGSNDYDGSFANHSEIKQQVAGFSTEWQATRALRLRANVGESFDESVDSVNGTYVGTVSSRRLSGGLQADVALGGGNDLVLGWDGLRDRIAGDTGYDVQQRYNRAVYAQWASRFSDAHDLQVNVRRDDNSQFGGKTTGSVLYGVRVGSGYRLTFSGGTAFKAPSFNELYYPYYGNPLLRPETARNLEIGLNYSIPLLSWSVHAFQNRVSDLIAHDSSILPFGAPNNIDKAVLSGLEAQFRVRVASVAINGNVTALSPRQEGGPFDGNLLPRRAQRTARLDFDWPLHDSLRLGLTQMGSSHRYDDLANSVRLAGYGRTDLRATIAVSPSWQLTGSVENVFDRAYETAAWYPQPGRSWLLTLRYAK